MLFFFRRIESPTDSVFILSRKYFGLFVQTDEGIKYERPK